MKGRIKKRALVKKDVMINDMVKGCAFDVSVDGMYIHTPETHFKENEQLTLSFDIDGKNADIKASVRHVDPGFGIGVKFLNMSPDMQTDINKFLNSALNSTAKTSHRVALLIISQEKPRNVYKLKLQQEGLFVLEASNGKDAIKFLRLSAPDIVIIDMQIEGISAVKIIQYIRNTEEMENVPVIALSTRYLSEEVDQTVALGVSEYLVKATTSPNILCSKVNKILSAGLE